MALFELHVVQASGTIEKRYSDRAVRLGQRLTIDAHRLVVVEELAKPDSPLATAAFLCTKTIDATTPPLATKGLPVFLRAA
jgi:hypothetical protein